MRNSHYRINVAIEEQQIGQTVMVRIKKRNAPAEILGIQAETQYLGWGVTFLDADNDGWPDLLLVNGHVYPEVDSQHLGSNFREPKILYHNNGNGTFTDISANAGPGITAVSSSRGLAAGDLWND